MPPANLSLWAARAASRERARRRESRTTVFFDAVNGPVFLRKGWTKASARRVPALGNDDHSHGVGHLGTARGGTGHDDDGVTRLGDARLLHLGDGDLAQLIDVL
jgi:hypothetical protein